MRGQRVYISQFGHQSLQPCYTSPDRDPDDLKTVFVREMERFDQVDDVLHQIRTIEDGGTGELFEYMISCRSKDLKTIEKDRSRQFISCPSSKTSLWYIV